MKEVTNPHDWSVFACMCRRARILLDVPRFCEEQGQPCGRERRPTCPKNGIGPHLWGQGCVDTICTDDCSIPTLCTLCLFGTRHRHRCCCPPTPMTLASGGSPMFPLVVHQPASPYIWPAVHSLRRGLSTNPGVTMWCVCGCS